MNAIETIRLFAEANETFKGVMFATGRISYIIDNVVTDENYRTWLECTKMSEKGKTTKCKIQYNDLKNYKTIVIYN